MGIYLTQVRIPNVSGLPEDVCINTFWFNHVNGSLGSGMEASIVAALKKFYDTDTDTAKPAPSTFLSSHLALASTEFRIYDNALPKNSPPIYTEFASINRTRTSTVDYPTEVAVVSSFAGAPVQGVPPARLRGRIFFGPLNASAATDDADAVRPSQGIRDALRENSQRLVADIRAIGGIIEDLDWVVWSRGKGTVSPENPDGTPDWTPFDSPVLSGWIDNAFDTQRRRGIAASGRSSWTV